MQNYVLIEFLFTFATVFVEHCLYIGWTTHMVTRNPCRLLAWAAMFVAAKHPVTIWQHFCFLFPAP